MSQELYKTLYQHIPQAPMICELENYVTQGFFTAWSVATPKYAISCFFVDEMVPPPENNAIWQGELHPPFDLASLTKPLYTNTLLRMQAENSCDYWDIPLHKFLPDYISPQCTLSLKDLLNHKTGLSAWMWMGQGGWRFSNDSPFAQREYLPKNKAKVAKTQLLSAICKQLSLQPQEECYSDLNYFLAAELLSLNLETLNQRFATKFKHASLLSCEMSKRHSVPSVPYVAQYRDYLPPTSAQPISGIIPNVHDTNAQILAEWQILSGHAGLLGSVLDVIQVIPFLAQTQPMPTPHPARFHLGLDTPQTSESLAGLDTWPLPHGTQIYGHLGYTGTAFWFKKEGQELKDYYVFLTNRTSERLLLGTPTLPRLLVHTDFTTQTSSYFLLQPYKKEYEPRVINRNDAEEIIRSLCRTYILLHNGANLRKPPNISNIRRRVGMQLWQKA